MASQSIYVDWKGNAIIKRNGNGVKAAAFTCFLSTALNAVSFAIGLNLVTYLQTTMHMGVARASTTATILLAASNGFAFIGAFISDSYITRFKTIVFFSLVEVLGLGLLTAQARLPSLLPPACENQAETGSCQEVGGYKAAIFFVSLYLYALGEGCARPAIPSLGSDQFDDSNQEEKRQKASYFNWYIIGFSSGVFIGVTLVVWVENTKGWDYGFGLSALIVLLGIIVLGSGFRFFRNLVPQGSPITRLVQVFVASFRNRKLSIPTNEDGLLKFQTIEDEHNYGQLPHTNGLKFLDKAMIVNVEKPMQDDNNQHISMLNKVEEAKIIVRMIPIFLCTMVSSMPIPLLLTLTIQQGTTMNTKVGSIHVSPATLVAIPVTFQLVMLVVYDRWIVSLLRGITGYTNGITPLWRIGIGFFFVPVSTFIAGLVEMRRMRVLKDHGLGDSDGTVPMSVMWLGFQFFVIGICDSTSYTGSLDFFNNEVSKGMKSIGSAIFFSAIGLCSLLGALLIKIVNKVTRGDNGMGWLDGDNLNISTIGLDKFYWFLSVVGFLSFLNYVFWANKYMYTQNQRVA